MTPADKRSSDSRNAGIAAAESSGQTYDPEQAGTDKLKEDSVRVCCRSGSQNVMFGPPPSISPAPHLIALGTAGAAILTAGNFILTL